LYSDAQNAIRQFAMPSDRQLRDGQAADTFEYVNKKTFQARGKNFERAARLELKTFDEVQILVDNLKAERLNVASSAFFGAQDASANTTLPARRGIVASLSAPPVQAVAAKKKAGPKKKADGDAAPIKIRKKDSGEGDGGSVMLCVGTSSGGVGPSNATEASAAGASEPPDDCVQEILLGKKLGRSVTGVCCLDTR
jgi:hypothetical protein